MDTKTLSIMDRSVESVEPAPLSLLDVRQQAVGEGAVGNQADLPAQKSNEGVERKQDGQEVQTQGLGKNDPSAPRSAGRLTGGFGLVSDPGMTVSMDDNRASSSSDSYLLGQNPDGDPVAAGDASGPIPLLDGVGRSVAQKGAVEQERQDVEQMSGPHVVHNEPVSRPSFTVDMGDTLSSTDRAPISEERVAQLEEKVHRLDIWARHESEHEVI